MELSPINEIDESKESDSDEDELQGNPLVKIIKEGSMEDVRTAILEGADLTSFDWGLTPLIAALEARRSNCVRLLVEHNVDVNQPDKYGNTPVLTAAVSGNAECMNLLCELADNLNTPDKNGDTALMWAFMKGHTECAATLIQHGVDLNQANKIGKMALDCALIAGYQEFGEFLRRKYAPKKIEFFKTGNLVCKNLLRDDRFGFSFSAPVQLRKTFIPFKTEIEVRVPRFSGESEWIELEVLQQLSSSSYHNPNVIHLLGMCMAFQHQTINKITFDNIGALGVPEPFDKFATSTSSKPRGRRRLSTSSRAPKTPPLSVAMVVSLCRGQNLETFLANNVEISIPAKKLGKFGADIARSLRHLHSFGYTHNDLRSGHFQFSEKEALEEPVSINQNLVLFNFSMACRISQEENHTEANPFRLSRVAWRWCSPELLNSRGCYRTVASDLWSLGIVLWELLGNRTLPFPTTSNPEELNELLSQSNTVPLAFPAHAPAAFIDLVIGCCAIDPKKRFTIKKVIKQLDKLSKFNADTAFFNELSLLITPPTATETHIWSAERVLLKATDTTQRRNSKYVQSRKKLTKLLAKEKNIDAIDRHAQTLLMCAAQDGRDEAVATLISHKASINVTGVYGRSPLQDACRNGHLETVKILLLNGADVNQTDLDVEKHTPLLDAIEKGHLDVVSLLLQHRADIDKTTRRGATPFHVAMESSNYNIAKFLVTSRANVNLCHVRTGNSPLIEATIKRTLSIIELLLEHDADVTIRNQENKHALDYAQERGLEDIVEPLKSCILKTSSFQFSTGNEISDVLRMFDGQFGTAFKATFKIGERSTIPVLCKIPKLKPHQNNWADLQILRNISRHENITPIISICSSFSFDSIRSIASITLDRSSHNLRDFIDTKHYIPSLMMAQLAVDLVKSILHVHFYGFTHNDVALRNFIIETAEYDEPKASNTQKNRTRPKYRALLHDFSLARPFEESLKSTAGVYPWAWSSPETILSNITTVKSDVFMLGVALWELTCLPVRPFHFISSAEEMVTRLEKTKQVLPLPIPRHCPSQYRDLVTQCTKFEPKQRPDVKALLKRLQALGEAFHDADTIRPKDAAAEYEKYKSQQDDEVDVYTNISGFQTIDERKSDSDMLYVSFCGVETDKEEAPVVKTDAGPRKQLPAAPGAAGESAGPQKELPLPPDINEETSDLSQASTSPPRSPSHSPTEMKSFDWTQFVDKDSLRVDDRDRVRSPSWKESDWDAVDEYETKETVYEVQRDKVGVPQDIQIPHSSPHSTLVTPRSAKILEEVRSGSDSESSVDEGSEFEDLPDELRQHNIEKAGNSDTDEQWEKNTDDNSEDTDGENDEKLSKEELDAKISELKVHPKHKVDNNSEYRQAIRRLSVDAPQAQFGMCGVLYKKNPRGVRGMRLWKQRYVILTQDSLQYFESAHDSVPKGEIKFSSILKLHRLSDRKNNRFAITIKETLRLFEFRASTAKNCEEWINNIYSNLSFPTPEHSRNAVQ